MPRAKSPNKSPVRRSKSKSRSRSRSRKATTPKSASKSRSRSRSSGRVAKKPVAATAVEPAKPKTPTRKSPARKAKSDTAEKVKPVTNNEKSPPTPIRVSRRLQEKAVLQVTESSKYGFQKSPQVVLHRKEVLHLRTSPKKLGIGDKYRLADQPALCHTDQNNNASSRDAQMKKKGDSFMQDKTDGVEKQPGTSASHAPAFGGTIGGALLTVALPALVFAITLATEKDWVISKVPTCPSKWAAFFNREVFGVVAAWYLLQLLLALIPVGPLCAGQPLKSTGQRLMYRCNGWLAFYATVILFAIGFHYGMPVHYVNQHWLQIVTAGVVYSFLIALFMYLRAWDATSNDLSPEANGSFFNDFFMGRELNPRFGNTMFDYKFFFELRAGLLGWMIINWCLLAAQFTDDNTVSPALAMVTVFQTLYVYDALRNEDAILTTLDITTEGFGFMLSFGDLAWVPYLYTLQARFLYRFPKKAISSPYALAGILALEFAGLILFRGANSQKNEFRKNPYNPDLAHLSSIPTAHGKRLLCSGFWGICRRPNYLGDLMMALAWCLPCGLSNPLPYFYPAYFFVLLVHRCIRDEAYCKERYGAAWDKYCSTVKYRIIPGIF